MNVFLVDNMKFIFLVFCGFLGYLGIVLFLVVGIYIMVGRIIGWNFSCVFWNRGKCFLRG